VADRAIWFCTLAIALAVISLSMVPSHQSAAAPTLLMTSQLTPNYSLTGVSFYSVAAGY